MSEDDTTRKQEENIRSFLDEHGQEGLYVLIFRNLIYRFVIQELKSPPESDDGDFVSIFRQGDPETIQSLKNDIRERSEHWARDLVSGLKDDGELDGLFELEGGQDLEVDSDRFQHAIHEKFIEWHEDSDDIVQEVREEYDF
ncbi:hypothetical protein [Halanaeroarchaeum sulfurireducens]|uniref:Uncharacterized protein n=1 Tax=Halanaeroarchaeum sulfurireducens TaxID=1604004 RepID=A0A0F7P9P8_9EURY|nr:hypothetical protein [Halanaeroarchaeum sulfurireducens]AKH97507.1 hypothetical protein HLASF_1018 [Halanaeroarchaeum sulfurireducens]ALG81903.1 hypothetical protein HLASA_1007 [Halanaeroarchaeum sulfurireducens]